VNEDPQTGRLNVSRRNKRKDKRKTKKPSGPTFLSVIAEELSGVNDTGFEKFLITVVFLLWMTVTAYTLELSLRIAPLEHVVVVTGDGDGSDGLVGVALRGSLSQNGETT
jgi:hypothetical protein